MKLFSLSGLALIAGLALSCNRSTNSSMEVAKVEPPVVSSAAADTVASGSYLNLLSSEKDVSDLKQSIPPQLPGKVRSGPQNPAPVPVDWDRKIVRNGDLSMMVKDFNSAGKQISAAVQLNGGYIANSNEQQLMNEIRNELTIKVPRERFEELVESIRKSGDSILQNQTTSADMTEEYVDVKARIRAKEQVRERYYEFLKKADKIKDVLAVEADLRQLDEEIEVATGRANYINHQSALSTIHLVYFQPLTVTTQPDATPGYAIALYESFNHGLEFLKQMGLVLVALWPVALVIGLIVWIFRRSRKTKIPALVVTPREA